MVVSGALAKLAYRHVQVSENVPMIANNILSNVKFLWLLLFSNENL